MGRDICSINSATLDATYFARNIFAPESYHRDLIIRLKLIFNPEIPIEKKLQGHSI